MGNIPEYPNPSAQMIAEGGCDGKCETCEGKEICWKDTFFAEKEKRDKALAEMKKDIGKNFKIDFPLIGTFCEIAINEGYRKADDVQKETLQKLFIAIKESGQLIDYSEFVGEGPFWAIDLDDLQEIIKQQFGVEVD